jgi:peptidoglycan hydrolase-like protein with peptidoglycan-binding domain
MAEQQSIVDLQQELNKNGAKVKVDGKMGPETQSALRQYQQKNNLRVTGSLDAETKAKLRI